MSKFNLFDESTWRTAVVVDIEKSITNKAVGAIGQIVHELRKIKQTLTTAPKYDQEDYVIARALKDINPEAYNIMQIEIIYSDEKVSDIIRDIDFIIDSWQDKEWRESNWKQLLPALNRLAPFLQKPQYGRSHYSPLTKLVNITVKGNAAWVAYRDIEKRRRACVLSKGNIIDIDIEEERDD